MIEVLAVARQLQEFCIEQGRRFCFIGGLVVQQVFQASTWEAQG